MLALFSCSVGRLSVVEGPGKVAGGCQRASARNVQKDQGTRYTEKNFKQLLQAVLDFIIINFDIFFYDVITL